MQLVQLNIVLVIFCRRVVTFRISTVLCCIVLCSTVRMKILKLRMVSYMISYIKGIVAYLEPNMVVVDNQGIGYTIYISEQTASKLPSPGQEVKLFTYMNVREDAMELFGFLTKDDLDFFKLLITVNGIGPKGAQAILSVMTPSELRFAIIAQDAKTISKAPGVGNKTAQRIILDLKDKCNLEDALQTFGEDVAADTTLNAESAKGEAVEALVALGYSSTEALKTLQKINITPDMDTETILKQALKQIHI